MTTTLIENRLVVLNSRHARKLNGSYNSKVIFEFPSLVIDTKDVIHNSITIDSVEIPHSYYNIDDNNNKINIKHEKISDPSLPLPDITNTSIITIPIGNYNAKTFSSVFLTQFNSVFSAYPDFNLDKQSGVYVFNPPADADGYTHRITFLSAGSTALEIMGLKNEDKLFTHTIRGTPFDFLCNFLGTKKINIFSDALAGHNICSSSLGETTIIASVSVNAPMFGMIHLNYLNTGESYLKKRSVSEIDIQVKDEQSNLLNFNNIDWTLTIHILTHRVKKEHVIENVPFLEEKSIDFSKNKEVKEKPSVKQAKKREALALPKSEPALKLPEESDDEEDILFKTL